VPGGGQDRVSEPLGSVRAALRPRGGGNRRPARGIGQQRPQRRRQRARGDVAVQGERRAERGQVPGVVPLLVPG
jgi:hypothetical protein